MIPGPVTTEAHPASPSPMIMAGWQPASLSESVTVTVIIMIRVIPSQGKFTVTGKLPLQVASAPCVTVQHAWHQRLARARGNGSRHSVSVSVVRQARQVTGKPEPGVPT